MSLRVQSYDDFLGEYDAAIEWLAELFGNTRIQKSRFGIYRKSLSEAIRAFYSGDDLPEEARIKFAHAHEEADALIEIHESIENLDPAILLPHAELLIKGQECRTPTGNDVARSTQFELVVAAKLARNGAQITLERRTDVVANFEDKEFLVECKRPLRIENLEQNYVDANTQISREISNYERPAGLIFLSLGHALNPKAGHLVVRDESHLHELCIEQHGRVREALFESDRKLMESKALAPCLLARAMVFRCRAHNQSTGRLLKVADSEVIFLQSDSEQISIIRRLLANQGA